MASPEKHLKEWSSRGLITAEQANAIRAFENSKPGSNWVVRSCLILGGTVIGIGLISIVAANWALTPPWLKLTGDFALLIGLATLAYRIHGTRSSLLFDALAVMFLVACLATIGLLAQLYPTGGKLHDALLIWSAIALPLTIFAEHRFVAILWTTALLSSLILRTVDHRWFGQEIEQWVVVLMNLPIFCAAFASGLTFLPRTENLVRSFRIWVYLTGIGGLSFADVMISAEANDRVAPQALALGYLLSLGTAVALLVRKDLASLSKGLAIAMLLLYSIAFAIAANTDNIPLVGAVISIAILGLAAVHFGTLGEKRIFSLLTLLIGIRFLVVYFQALGGLAATGVGLVVSGLLIIGLVVAWNRMRARLQTWVEGLAR